MQLLSSSAICKFRSDNAKVYQVKYFILIGINTRELRRVFCFLKRNSGLWCFNFEKDGSRSAKSTQSNEEAKGYVNIWID
jgi:hypothetical protein